MQIKSIKIENIKGIEDIAFNLDLLPNKPNILVAPNGFGKSSFAIAFNSLKTNKIDIDDKNYFNNDPENRPSLSLTYKKDGFEDTLIANDTQNSINNVFDVFVINNQVEPKSTVQKFGGNTFAKSSLEIPPIILIKTIPVKVLFNYSSSTEKRNFGKNGSKILKNISEIFKVGYLFYRIENEIDLKKFSLKGSLKKISEFKDLINEQSGTGQEIREWIAENLLVKFREFEYLKNLSKIICDFNFPQIANELDCYLTSFQMISVFQSNEKEFKKASRYLYYLDEKEDYIQLISSFNSTRFDIKPKEVKKKQLIVSFPKAHEISNGQRDVLSFIILLLKAKKAFRKENCILIIDEIFDYLDDGNMISFQYFITNYIEEMKNQGRNIFPILLTHLDPLFFNHFVFNKHKIKVHYLKEMNIKASNELLKLIYKRTDELIKNEVDAHFFHFHPENVDLTTQFNSLNLNLDWAKSENFHTKIQREVRRYLYPKGNEKYDPLAICFGVRIKIENLIYDRIHSEEHKQGFINENGTKKKLQYCENMGIDIPEIYYLLGIIYNTSLHLKVGQDISNPLAIKLENITIKKLIKDIFEEE